MTADHFPNCMARVAALLERAEALLLKQDMTESDRAIADSCRETAKELRLAAVAQRSLDARLDTVERERGVPLWPAKPTKKKARKPRMPPLFSKEDR